MIVWQLAAPPQGVQDDGAQNHENHVRNLGHLLLRTRPSTLDVYCVVVKELGFSASAVTTRFHRFIPHDMTYIICFVVWWCTTSGAGHPLP